MLTKVIRDDGLLLTVKTSPGIQHPTERFVSKQRPMKKERNMAADMRKHASCRKGKHACNYCPGDPQTCDNCGELCIIANKRKISGQNEAQSLNNETEQSIRISVSQCRWAARISVSEQSFRGGDGTHTHTRDVTLFVAPRCGRS